jgi:arsenite-transporting ATPase
VRVILFTGKGGVGKTTVAAGTAAVAARRGLKTLVLSTDPAHSLGDVFGIAVPGGEPVEAETGLYVQQVAVHRRFEHSWAQVQSYLLELLDAAGVAPVEAAELTVLPGAAEVLALLEVRDQVRHGPWDLVVVDCAPTGETLRLLALPEALGRTLHRMFPVERRVARALRPVLRPALGKVGAALPAPGERVFEALERLQHELADVRALLAGDDAAVRIVLTPETLAVAEARRTLTSLTLYGYRVDAVIANRIIPADGDPWRAGWASAQQARLAEVEASFAPLPVHRAPYAGSEPVGVDALAELGRAVYADHDPGVLGPARELLAVERDGEEYVLRVDLPFATREEVDLARSGDELVITIGAHRRLLTLPSALRRCAVTGAALRENRLRIRFRPDPEQWRAP